MIVCEVEDSVLFFFKQKTAYEIQYGLVGSEMCIRDRSICFVTGVPGAGKTLVGLNIANKYSNKEDELYSVFLSGNGPLVKILREALTRDKVCLLYTSDAADERSSVDLGGRRIIKKKKKIKDESRRILTKKQTQTQKTKTHTSTRQCR